MIEDNLSNIRHPQQFSSSDFRTHRFSSNEQQLTPEDLKIYGFSTSENEESNISRKNSMDMNSFKVQQNTSETEDYLNKVESTNMRKDFINTISSQKAKAGYKWSRIPRQKRLPLRIDRFCDACQHLNDKKPISDKTIYLEHDCCHRMHQSCNASYSRAIWEFNGHLQGYQLKDCPICFVESNISSYKGPHPYPFTICQETKSCVLIIKSGKQQVKKSQFALKKSVQ